VRSLTHELPASGTALQKILAELDAIHLMLSIAANADNDALKVATAAAGSLWFAVRFRFG
jgi:hypothetical protein